MVCNICDNVEKNIPLEIKEMFFSGSRDIYHYFECSSCGCVQMRDLDFDTSNIYDNATYDAFADASTNFVRQFAIRSRDKYAILKKSRIIGRLMNKIYPLPIGRTIINDYASVDSSIMEIGCGGGGYLATLHDIGFRSLVGFDPYIDNEFLVRKDVIVKKQKINEISGKYDIVFMYHAFEHLPNPLEVLSMIKKLLNPNGVCIITIPVAEELYRLYRESTYYIQAPQHYFLHTLKSMDILAVKSGLKITDIKRDASGVLYCAMISEQWKKDIPCKAVSYKEIESLSNYDEVKKKIEENNYPGDNVVFVMKSIEVNI